MKWREILVTAVIATFFATVASFAISPPFPQAWTPAYENIPADTEQESLGASRIRDFKSQIRQRLSQDHSWAGDGNDGFHNTVTLMQQSADPVPSLDGGKTAGILYSKLVGSRDELFYKDSAGTVTQMTTAGVLDVVTVQSGTVFFTASSTIPTGWDACDGAAHNRTTEAGLFAAIGTTYGAGDGVSTFNVPDARGRTIFGFDSGNATARLTGNTGTGLSASGLGNHGGEQSHTLTVAEMPAHTHANTLNDPGHSHSVNAQGAAAQGAGGGATTVAAFPASSITGAAVTGMSINNASAGSGGTHNNIPPGIVMNCIIKQ